MNAHEGCRGVLPTEMVGFTSACNKMKWKGQFNGKKDYIRKNGKPKARAWGGDGKGLTDVRDCALCPQG